MHNLLAWEDHLSTLFAIKAEGRVRYVGITTSEGRRHGEVEKIMLWAMGSPEIWILVLAAILVLGARRLRRSHAPLVTRA